MLQGSCKPISTLRSISYIFFAHIVCFNYIINCSTRRGSFLEYEDYFSFIGWLVFMFKHCPIQQTWQIHAWKLMSVSGVRLLDFGHHQTLQNLCPCSDSIILRILIMLDHDPNRPDPDLFIYFWNMGIE